MTRALKLLACLCALVLACTHDRTQIILITDTDMPQGPTGLLTHVRVRVGPSGSSQLRLDRIFTLGANQDAGESFLPSTLGIAALDNDGRRTVTVRLDAIRAAPGTANLDGVRPLFTARAIVPFVQEKTLRLPMFLYASCENIPCGDDQTCRDGLCVDARQQGVEIDPNAPVDAAAFRPPPRDGSSLPRDGMSDAAPDTTDAPAPPEDAPVSDTSPVTDVVTCPAGMTECEGACVDLARTLGHCGRCRNACPSPARATATCANGACGFTCLAGSGDCDNDRSNGCETDLTTTTTHCGACGMACSIPNGAAACAGAACAVAGCNAGFGDCDLNPANGCETNLGQTAAHCGRCGQACVLSHATAVCRGGSCAIGTCDTGFGDCDGDPDNGCETDTRSNANHCGGCRQACTFANAGAACVNGTCALGMCITGFGDCDRNATNGCETDTRTSAAHCGGCGQPCAMGTACGAMTCATTCPPGTTNCSSSCVDTATDVNHCGGCGQPCARPNAFPSCRGGVCGVMTCRPPWGNCDGNDTNGCETDTNVTLAHCGACGRACNLAHATARCNAGVCQVAACDAGFGDCNLDPLDGCETDLRANSSNCGVCNNTCTRTNATATCAASQCVIDRCNLGYGDCDGVDGNGCETATSNNLAHCGACRAACVAPANASARCDGTACGFQCGTGFTDCNASAADGCETNVAANPTHCGRCGNACSFPNATAVCAAGACALGACNAGFANCDGNAQNGCETNTGTSPSHCGGCGRPCATGQVCSNATCVSNCAAGLTLCNGACVNLATDLAHCGACNRQCSTSTRATPTCMASACGFRCNAGYGDCDRSPANDCETDTLTNVNHCGGCNNRCTFANGTPSCMNGNCAGTCAADYSDCNDLALDGCETHVTDDPFNCGGCGQRCATNALCQNRQCVCPTGQTLCNGVCVDVNSNPSHCGRCNNFCFSGTCLGGMCYSPDASVPSDADATVPFDDGPADTDVPVDDGLTLTDRAAPDRGIIVIGPPDTLDASMGR